MTANVLRSFVLGAIAALLSVELMCAATWACGLSNTVLLLANSLHRLVGGANAAMFLALAAHMIGGGLLAIGGPRISRIALVFVGSAALAWHGAATSFTGWPTAVARFGTLLGFALGLVLYERLVAVLQLQHRDASREFTPSTTRRGFVAVATIGGAAGGLAIGRAFWRASALRYARTEYRPLERSPLSGARDFYCVTDNLIDPQVDDALWHLEVGGLAQAPAAWRIHDFHNAATTDLEVTLMSRSNKAGGGLISNAIWTGVPVLELVQNAQPLAAASGARCIGVDGHHETFPLDSLTNALLAFEMNRKRLPHRQGQPLRLIVPGEDGERCVKWLTRIELVAAATVEREAPKPRGIPMFTRIDSPCEGAIVPRGIVQLGGIAYAAAGDFQCVEVNVDGVSDWQTADVVYDGSPWSWKLWQADVELAPGDHVVAVRGVAAATRQTDDIHRVRIRVA